VDQITDSIAAFFLSLSDDTKAADDSPKNKTKVKTRPEATIPTTDKAASSTTSSDAASNAPAESIAVSSDSLTVFERMFSIDVPSCSTKWQDLVAALIEAGFTGAHTSGSAVAFTRGKQGGSIAIHKLHPDHSFPLNKLKVVGKRLQKWFGWNEDTFVEKPRTL
jgi:hypothetical protein